MPIIMEEHKNTNECENSCKKKPVIVNTGNYYRSRTVLTDIRVPLNVTKVSEKLRLEKNKWVITFETFLIPGEIVQIGKLKLKYRIVKEKGFSSKTTYPKYEVRKVCGEPFSTVDEDNIKVGGRVNIINRKTEVELFEIVNKLQ